MNKLYKQYQIPIELISIINSYLYDWRDIYKLPLSTINKGLHSRERNINTNKVYDSYKINTLKGILTIKLSATEEGSTNWLISNSSPIFHCIKCRKYHRLFGIKYCTRYGITI